MLYIKRGKFVHFDLFIFPVPNPETSGRDSGLSR